MQAPKEIEDTLITLGFDPSEIYDESVRWQLSYPDTDLDSFGLGYALAVALHAPGDDLDDDYPLVAGPLTGATA